MEDYKQGEAVICWVSVRGETPRLSKGMADKSNNRGSASDPGVIHKAARLEAHTLTDAELTAINK